MFPDALSTKMPRGEMKFYFPFHMENTEFIYL